MNKLEPGQLWVFRIQAWIVTAIILLAAGIGELISLKIEPLPAGVIFGVALLIVIWPAFFAPGRAYRAFRWKSEAEELHIHHGHLTHVETIVPFRRVQHIDVVQHAIARIFGLTALVLHTAGTVSHRVVLPGLHRETAEAIRDEIRAVIAREANER